MKILLSLLSLLLLPMAANAYYDVVVDGIYYDISQVTKEATVTSGDTKYTGSVVIPANFILDGVMYNVIGIGASAFISCSDLSSVSIPNSVTSIDGSAFMGCEGLLNLTIPNSVLSIGSNAFYGCSGLTSVTIGSGVKSIGRTAFEKCNSLTSVHILDIAAWCNISFDTEYRSSNPLYYAEHLYLNGIEVKDLVIPNGVTYIGKQAFYNYDGLATVTIPSSVISIQSHAFQNCSGLTSVTIPDGVISIGESAFAECYSLASVTIGSGLKSIGGNAFMYCSDLKSVHISDLSAWFKISFGKYDSRYYSNPLSYAEHLYLNGIEVKDLVVPNDVTSIGGGIFYGCKGLSTVTIPNSVLSIGSDAFRYCSGLTSVTIGNGVTSIGSYAFSYCSRLATLSIGNGIQNIDNRAFYYCVGLSDVFCYSENVPFLNPGSFQDSDLQYKTLHVPGSAVDAYKADEEWKKFGSIVALKAGDPGNEETQKQGDLNSDNTVNGTDLVLLTQLVLTSSFNSSADLNNDGLVNGTDYVLMVNKILGK